MLLKFVREGLDVVQINFMAPLHFIRMIVLWYSTIRETSTSDLSRDTKFYRIQSVIERISWLCSFGCWTFSKKNCQPVSFLPATEKKWNVVMYIYIGSFKNYLLEIVFLDKSYYHAFNYLRCNWKSKSQIKLIGFIVLFRRIILSNTIVICIYTYQKFKTRISKNIENIEIK